MRSDCASSPVGRSLRPNPSNGSIRLATARAQFSNPRRLRSAINCMRAGATSTVGT